MAAASSSSSSSRSHWPPGFRFRPTDQELVGFYLSRKVAGRPIQAGVIAEIDLYKCEPWDLPDKSPFQNDVEWYFFCARDKKYPNGSRTNRATEAGYWKATGKDRVVRSGSKGIGMKKTLVFYKGRAPHGQRTEWIMHEYRLEGTGKQQQQQFQDAYVLCRVFKKGAVLKSEEEVPSYLDDEFACPSPSFAPAAPEPDEGQVCSPSPAEIAHNTVAPSGPEENADDSLNAFLMMLLEEPSVEESQMLPLGTQESGGLVEPTLYGSLVDEPDTLEQLLQQAEEGNSVLENVDNPQFVGDEMSVMDMLAGDFIELNDLLPSRVQQSYEQHDSPIDLSKYLESEVVPSATKVVAYDGVGDEGMLIMPPAQASEGQTTTMVVLEGGQRHPVKRFLGMLGSIHVLPASAAEYPGSSSKVKAQHRPGADCSAIHMNVAVTFACSCLSKKKSTEGLDRVVAKSSTKRRSNLFFVFLVGSVSALFWILLLPALLRLSSYVHAAPL